jgi:hypothetical protein
VVVGFESLLNDEDVVAVIELLDSVLATRVGLITEDRERSVEELEVVEVAIASTLVTGLE